MGCTNITPLVLSDTFNTWFERTNECIEGLNTLSLRGLSATNISGTDIEGFVIEEDNNCFYTINLRTGPFIGFIGASDGGYSAGIHGTGSYEDPYNLTLRFTGTEQELSREEIATGDYLIVSDTDDSQLFKKAPATAFITDLRQGNNIKIVENSDGSYTISYNEISYIVNNPNVTGNNSWTNSNEEIGTSWDGELTFSIETSVNSDVLMDSATVTINQTDENFFVGGFTGYDLTVSSGVGSISIDNLEINFDNYSINNPSINFNFNTTSATADTEGNPIEALNSPQKQVNKSYYMRFWTFFLINEPSDAQDAINSIENASSIKDHELITQPNNRFSFLGLTHGFSEDAIFCLAYTVKPGGGDVGYTPKLYPNDGNVAEDSSGFFELGGTASYNNGYTYKIWTTANSFGGSGINFGVENAG